MTISARILADSVAPNGVRLVTIEATYPRFIHSELMTHRAFSRNAASSRAIPVERLISAVYENPATPVSWGKNQKGMQADEELSEDDAYRARKHWLIARDNALAEAEALMNRGVHKQIANRLLEPFCHMTTIISATDWANFFHLRCSPHAQPEFKCLAEQMRAAIEASTPVDQELHLPLVELFDEGSPLYVSPHDVASLLPDTADNAAAVALVKKLSAARCARVSYLTHDGVRDLAADLDLHDRLVANGHWSPFEHVATALPGPWREGNFRGWRQYRKEFSEECVVDVDATPAW